MNESDKIWSSAKKEAELMRERLLHRVETDKKKKKEAWKSLREKLISIHEEIFNSKDRLGEYELWSLIVEFETLAWALRKDYEKRK